MSRIFQAFAPLLLIVSGCSGGAADEPPLAGARIGGPFALTDPAGKTVRDGDFAGKYRIVYFGYTWCPDICPNDMLKIGQAMKTLDKQAPDKAKAIVPIFITVDPERDTPKVVGEFVRNFDDRIVGLTGTPAAIQAVTRQYAVYAKKEAPGPGGAYLVGHSQIAYLMDRDGKPITSLPIEKDAPALVAELEHWVK
ncbi:MULTISPECIES: SCO family protein [unclassified Sphingomonas]|uniref:SCO family protein n=1 Tax=unclassified Sphingomonas TaxID=196159 RepID=UPI0022B32FB1|nr:SCO family protein [Sphingomonas sp. NIBR02145]WHU01583.1 SCO family protein [Sphingomonas sp. NIBR02145]